MASCLVPVTGAAASLPSYEKQLELLSDLSLLPDTFVDDFKPQKGMSRAEFASLCTAVFNLKEYDGRADMTNVFADVISTSRYFEDIMEVSSFGLMTGDGGVNFNPDEKITYEAVVKVIMTALGYDKMAQALGGYPYGYIRLAGDNNITDGISGSTDKGYIIGADIIIMMYNALNVAVLSIDCFRYFSKSLEG